MVRTILRTPSAVLTTLTAVAEPVTVFDDELRQLATDLADTCTHFEGAGLAAPQIDVNLRVMYVSTLGPDHRTLVNPSWHAISESWHSRANEGCLSLPGVGVTIERAEHIVVQAQSITGEPVTFTANGLSARIIQHECDHLDGVLIVDHLTGLNRKLMLDRYRKDTKRQTRRVNAALRQGGLSIQTHS